MHFPDHRWSSAQRFEYTLAKEVGTRLWRLMRDCTRFMIVEVADLPYYVQFLPTPDGDLIGETVGDAYLTSRDKCFRISTAQEIHLNALGWISTPFNFKQRWSDPIPFCEIGIMSARTLIGVHGITPQHHVCYSYGEAAWASLRKEEAA